MPIFQSLTTRFNQSIGDPERADLEGAAAATSLVEAFDVHDIFEAGEREFIETIPEAISGAMLGAIKANLERGKGAVAITFAWRPGYDFGLELYDTPGTPESKGGITMIVTTRYPRDLPHPKDT